MFHSSSCDPLLETRALAWQEFIGQLDGIMRPRFGTIEWHKRYNDFNAWLRRCGRPDLCIPIT
jgi:hypothetical protein